MILTEGIAAENKAADMNQYTLAKAILCSNNCTYAESKVRGSFHEPKEIEWEKAVAAWVDVIAHTNVLKFRIQNKKMKLYFHFESLSK